MSILQEYLKEQFQIQANYDTVSFLRSGFLYEQKQYPNLDTIKNRSYTIATIEKSTNEVHYFNFQVLKIKPGSNNYLSFFAETEMENIFKQVLSENDFGKLDKFTDFFTNREMYQNILFNGHVVDGNNRKYLDRNGNDLTWLVTNNFDENTNKTITVNDYVIHLIPNFLDKIATDARISLSKRY